MNQENKVQSDIDEENGTVDGHTFEYAGLFF